MSRVMYEFLRLVPKNRVSRMTGYLVHSRLPMGMQRRLIRWFIRHYDIDTSEIEQPVDSFTTLGDFFVRRLKAGARPIGGALVAPVDGTVSAHGPLDEGTRLVQAKGIHYDLEGLLVDPDEVAAFRGGSFLTIYLAPHNYHRIHAPAAGHIVKLLFTPGRLWPVNHITVGRLANLFSINERLTTILELPAGGRIAVVKVGAMNVGRISLAYEAELATNGAANRDRFDDELHGRVGGLALTTHRKHYPEPKAVAAGDELGVFELGSTVICCFSPGIQLSPPEPGSPIRMGEPIGQLAASPSQ